MLRLMLVPFILLITILFSIIVIWIVYKKIKRGVEVSVKKGAELANDQQQKWADKAQRKKLPSIVKKGFDNYDQIKLGVENLPNEWKRALNPIVSHSKEILDEIALEFESDPSAHKKKVQRQNKKLNSVRAFFHHSLDALLQFIEKLKTDHKTMSSSEIEKAHENITVFKADLLKHQETLHKVRRFDFDVVMDVIKARLKS